jgi:hypothetical protein
MQYQDSAIVAGGGRTLNIARAGIWVGIWALDIRSSF